MSIARPTPRASRRARRRVLALGCLLVASTSIGGNASGEDAPGLPPSADYSSTGTVTASQGVVVRRSKLFLTTDQAQPVWGLVYYQAKNGCADPARPTGRPIQCAPGQEPTRSSGSFRVPWPFKPLPTKADDPEEQDPCVAAKPDEAATYIRAALVFTSAKVTGAAPGGQPRYASDRLGEIATIPVRMLAFGSVPATALVTLSMAKKADGAPKPWQLQFWQPTGYTCAQRDDFTRTLIEGKAEIRLHDLEIDGVPVDLGPSCRTSRPTDVALWGEKGYGALTGGLMGQYTGMPLGGGTVTPLRTAGFPDKVRSLYEEDEGRMLPDARGVDVAPFSGCGVSEDLDPLITAMASGPDNPLAIRQGRTTTAGIELSDLGACDIGGCPLPAPLPPPRPQ